MKRPYRPTVRWTGEDFLAWHRWLEETFHCEIVYSMQLHLPNHRAAEPRVIAEVYRRGDSLQPERYWFHVDASVFLILSTGFWEPWVPLHGRILERFNQILASEGKAP